MILERYFSTDRLAIAWQQIQGGQNLAYKCYFKHIYKGYEFALAENLSALSAKLISGGFKNKQIQRIFIPKSPTSQRPITLLSIEDQIAYQALAAYIADKIAAKRRAFELKCVFSNILAEDRTQFIFENWKYCYLSYQEATEQRIESGQNWVVTCDLASFYDTISHNILFNQVPGLKSHGDEREYFSNILSGWTFESPSELRSHGIPQGPIASDLLAEVFMLVLDEILYRNKINYIRYVDDIRIFAKTRTDAQRIALHLERILRGIGLVPQPEKFSIVKLKSGKELHKIEVSSDHHLTDDPTRERITLSTNDTEQILNLALEEEDLKKGKPPNRTKVRFAFFRGKSNEKTRAISHRLAEQYPQFVEAAFVFLRRSTFKRSTIELAKKILNDSPFGFVQYKCWTLLHNLYDDLLIAEKRILAETACDTLKHQSNFEPSALIGAAQFLLLHSHRRNNKHNAFVFNLKNRFVLALALRHLEGRPFGLPSTGFRRIHSELPDIGLGILHKFDVIGTDLQNATNQRKVGHCPYLRSLKMLSGKKSGGAIDPVGLGAQALFGIEVKCDLKIFLGIRWQQALRYLARANLYRDKSPSIWLRSMNQFGELIVRAVVGKHNKHANKGTVIKAIPKNGRKSVTYGHLIDNHQKLCSLYPNVFDGFREVNDRRNNDTESHAIDEKTGRRSRGLIKKTEQKRLQKKFSSTLSKVLELINSNGW